jgi:hypothetical protein
MGPGGTLFSVTTRLRLLFLVWKDPELDCARTWFSHGATAVPLSVARGKADQALSLSAA